MRELDATVLIDSSPRMNALRLSNTFLPQGGLLREQLEPVGVTGLLWTDEPDRGSTIVN